MTEMFLDEINRLEQQKKKNKTKMKVANKKIGEKKSSKKNFID